MNLTPLNNRKKYQFCGSDNADAVAWHACKRSHPHRRGNLVFRVNMTKQHNPKARLRARHVKQFAVNISCIRSASGGYREFSERGATDGCSPLRINLYAALPTRGPLGTLWPACHSRSRKYQCAARQRR
jgi:hypothetical protein